MKNQFLLRAAALFILGCVFCNFVFAQDEEYMLPLADSRWVSDSDGVTRIPVCFENPEGFETEVQWVKSAIGATWEYHANIDFQGWSKCNSNSRGIRILVKDARSKSIVGSGMDGIYGGMELNFTFRNFNQSCQNNREYCIKGVAIHEFGHALGFTHEQNRVDSTCKKDQDLSRTVIPLTPYDEDSVMNYCNPNWMEGLSKYDIQGIQIQYGKKTNIVNYGRISVYDELGEDQVWEEVKVKLNKSTQTFTINALQPNRKFKWKFSRTGRYCFEFTTRALHTDGNIYNGYGEKCYSLEAGTTYKTLNLARSGWNSGGYFDLIVE